MTYAEILIKKGKRGAAAFVQAECMSNKGAANGGRSFNKNSNIWLKTINSLTLSLL